MPNGLRVAMLLPVAVVSGLSAGSAAEHMSADDVRGMVAAARGEPIDVSGRDMMGDDLSGLDLSGAKLTRANLTGANLHGVKLVGTDLSGAVLVDADLTFAWFIRANFAGANLHGATLRTVVTSAGMDNTKDQAARFDGADLSGTHTTVHFSSCLPSFLSPFSMVQAMNIGVKRGQPWLETACSSRRASVRLRSKNATARSKNAGPW